MQLSHYISPGEIIIPLKGTTKEKVFAELADCLAKENHIKEKDKLIAAILERESSASTFLPMGVAIPHARVSYIKDIRVVMGVSPRGIKDTFHEGPPLTANVFCMFFSPTKEKEFGKHLKFLSRIAAIFSDTKLVPELAKMKTADEVFYRIQERERDISEE